MNLSDLKQTALKIRIDILKSINSAKSGHTGGSLGLADIFTALYFKILNHNPKNPNWDERDRLILSIGHVAPVLYTTLAHANYFETEELLSLRKLGSRLQGHPGKDHGLPGIELSAGSLGQGLSVSIGLALSSKLKSRKNYIYCIMGDGELQEGSVWEAAMSAAHHNLNNIIAIVDRNNVQIDGKTEDVMNIEPLQNKWEAFGWKCFNCNGNDIQDFIQTVEKAKSSNLNNPKIIIAKTKMGAGVKSIENDYKWHGKAPNDEELEAFINELNNSQL
jgi:transketolase